MEAIIKYRPNGSICMDCGEHVPKQKELNLTELFENLNLFDE